MWQLPFSINFIGCSVKTAKGVCCVFPFKYQNKLYHSCTTVNNGGKRWCAVPEPLHTAFLSDRNYRYVFQTLKIQHVKIFFLSHHVCNRTPQKSRLYPLAMGDWIKLPPPPNLSTAGFWKNKFTFENTFTDLTLKVEIRCIVPRGQPITRLWGFSLFDIALVWRELGRYSTVEKFESIQKYGNQSNIDSPRRRQV